MNFREFAKKASLTLILSMLCLIVFAQGRQVTGLIQDTSGEAMIGVNVLVKGTTNGTITDFDGNFTLTGVNDSDILVISFIGFQSQEIPVRNQSVFNVTLREDTQALDEVVVVGYGVQKKSDLTGSVGSVDNSQLTGRGATTVMESLQGQIAGVDISQSSSRVGESFSIQIRGKSSIQKGGEPLYVVDGVVCDDINFLNPADIEKIDILKDASSTAIYGSRATNGVVMVTTKQAKLSGEPRVNISYDGHFGFKQVARMPDFMDDVEWMDYRYMKYVTPVKNTGIVDGRLALEMTPGNLLSVWNDKGSDISTKMRDQFLRRDFTDWRDLALNNGTQQNHFVNVTGNVKNTAYRVGAGYQQEDGMMGDAYERFNLRTAVDSKINSYVSLGASVNLTAFNHDLGSKRSVQEAFRANGYWLPYNTETGELNYQPGKDLRPGQATSPTFPAGFSSSVSPLMDALHSKDETKGYRVLANAYLQVQPIQEVILKTTFSPNYFTRRRGEFYGGLSSERASTYNINTGEGVPLATVDKREGFSYTWDTQANYVKTFGDHNVNAMALFSIYDRQYERYGYSSEGVLPGTDWYNMGSGSSILSPLSEYSRISMLSYALRLNYSYKGKYLVTASTRWDGSSKFQKDERWGMFPSAAFAWRISEEAFVKENANWISNLKLRLSYGATGNNGAVGAYDTQSLASKLYYYGFGSQIAKGYGPNGVVNEMLTWEKTNEINIGLDFGFLNGRISGTFDWYNKKSRDLLMEQKLKIEQGASNGTMWANIGKVQNQGIEALLKVIPVQTKDWYWDVTFSFAKNNNKILELQNGKEDMRAERWFIGQPIDVIYDLKMTGICTQEYANEVITVGDKTGTRSEIYGWYEGSMTFEDVNQNGKIDDGDRQIIGQQLPKWTGSINTSVSFKNWDFSVALTTKQGHKLYSPFMDEFTDYSDRGRTKLSMDFYIPQGAPILNYTWDGTNTSSLTSDRTVVAEQTKVGSYPYPLNDVAYNHGGSTGWRTGKNTEFNPNGVVDASYVKIKNITLGYTFDRSLVNKIHIQSLRIYANVLNPFTFTKYKGFDPEWADASISNGNGGPSSVTYQIGVNLKF